MGLGLGFRVGIRVAISQHLEPGAVRVGAALASRNAEASLDG